MTLPPPRRLALLAAAFLVAALALVAREMAWRRRMQLQLERDRRKLDEFRREEMRTSVKPRRRRHPIIWPPPPSGKSK